MRATSRSASSGVEFHRKYERREARAKPVNFPGCSMTHRKSGAVISVESSSRNAVLRFQPASTWAVKFAVTFDNSVSVRSRRNNRAPTRANVFRTVASNSPRGSLVFDNVAPGCRKAARMAGVMSLHSQRSPGSGNSGSSTSTHCTARPGAVHLLASEFFGTGTPSPKGIRRIPSSIDRSLSRPVRR